jgi:hypothetical protein
MAITLKDTLLDLRLTEDDVEAHIREIIKARPTGAERRAAISYVRQLVQRDEADLGTYRALLARARAVLEERQDQHSFDIRDTKLGSLFTTASNVDYKAPLLISNSEVIAEGVTITPTGTHLIVIGDYVSLHGIGTGRAVDETLECGCIVNGGLSIDADNVLIEGVEFKSQAGAGALKTVLFAGASQNVTFRNCRFDGALFTDTTDPAYGGSIFFHGTNFSGSFTLENCEIKNYTSWMLADLNSDSQQPPPAALSKVVIKDCRFFDCKGSFACRGLIASPTESASITGCSWSYTLPLTATSMHGSFWNAYEVNNCKEIVCRHNTFAGTRLGGNGVRGFLQVWSKADVHYVLEFEKNTVSGLDYLVQIAANSSFYSPDQKDRRLLIKSEAGKITDVSYGLSLFYPWATGVWDPIDAVRYPTAPATDFADALLNKT